MNNNYIVLNNKKIDISKTNPNTSVLDWIRLDRELKGTKEGCAEGDCGACSVLISPIRGGKFKPANSCLLKLGQVSGSEIVTVEGLGNQKHPSTVQETLTNLGASQCGFCTPGFVIAITGLLCNNNKPTEDDIHDALAGNLCRCTGYRPIIDTVKNVKFKNNFKECSKWINTDKFQGKHAVFYYPKTLKEAYNASLSHKNIKYLSGGTDLNLQSQDDENILNYILLNRIPELLRIDEANNEIQIGASVTLEESLPLFEKYFSPFAEILRRFGSSQIRSQATIAGNLCTASPIGDVAPSLMALGSSIEIFSNNINKYLAIEDLFTDYRKTVLNPNDIVTSINIPIPSKDKKFYAWKVSKRYDQDISTVSMAALIGMGENNIIQSCRICFGGLSATTFRSREIENSFIGIIPNQDHNKILEITKKSIKPLSDLRGSANYRINLALGLIKRLLFMLSNNDTIIEVMKVKIDE